MADRKENQGDKERVTAAASRAVVKAAVDRAVEAVETADASLSYLFLIKMPAVERI